MTNIKGKGTTGNNTTHEGSQVIDFTQIREQKLEEKRRTTERVFFKHLLSVYTVAGRDSMFPVDIMDVSDDGIAFQVPFDPQKPWPADLKAFPLRLYFSQDTYMEVHVSIQNSRAAIENHARFLRLGCAIDKTTSSYPAYQSFVHFLKSYCSLAQKDKGGTSIFYL